MSETKKSGSSIDTMSRPELLKKFGQRIKKDFGVDELNLIKREGTGPGGIVRMRNMIKDLVLNTGGLVKKTYVNPVTVVNHLKK